MARKGTYEAHSALLEVNTSNISDVYVLGMHTPINALQTSYDFISRNYCFDFCFYQNLSVYNSVTVKEEEEEEKGAGGKKEKGSRTGNG